MERRIGKFEIAPAIANEFASFSLVGILELENAPHEKAIKKALDILQNHHPALRSKLSKKGSAYFFQSLDIPKIPLSVEERVSDTHWITRTESFLNNSVDWKTGPLLNCAYLKNTNPAGRSELIFSFHHSIADAISLTSFLEDFLNLCVSQQSGKPIEGFDGYPPLPAVEEMFPRSHKGIRMTFRTLRFMARQMASEMTIMRKTRGKRKPPIHVDSTSRLLTMDLSEKETAALEKQARKHKVTLSSVQHAAILTASWQHLYNLEAMPMKYILFQNLRPYLDPPLTQEVLGSYIAMIQLVIDMDPNQDFWDLCQKINQSVYQAGKTGDKFISANMSGTLLQMLFRFKSFRMGVTAMNYSGAIPLQKSYGDIKVVGVRGFVSNFGLGPEFTAQTMIFNGKLSWNIIYLETDMNAETAGKITNEIKEILISKAISK